MFKLPARAGVGFKPDHFSDIQLSGFDGGWFEIHAENYMADGGPSHTMLEKIRRDFPISCHGVGLSIGAARPLDANHLKRLRKFCDRYQPDAFSEHLAWSSHNVGFLNDLLPLPYTEDTLNIVSSHVDQVQQELDRKMFLENPSSYLSFEESIIPETEFLAEIAARTGCGLLLDVNNVYVSANNLNFDAAQYLAAFPMDRVGEIHLAGFSEDQAPHTGRLLIDDHGSPVADPVWQLYQDVMDSIGPVPTLIEWDNNIPDWQLLKTDADRANEILAKATPRREVLHAS